MNAKHTQWLLFGAVFSAIGGAGLLASTAFAQGSEVGDPGAATRGALSVRNVIVSGGCPREGIEATIEDRGMGSESLLIRFPDESTTADPMRMRREDESATTLTVTGDQADRRCNVVVQLAVGADERGERTLDADESDEPGERGETDGRERQQAAATRIQLASAIESVTFADARDEGLSVVSRFRLGNANSRVQVAQVANDDPADRDADAQADPQQRAASGMEDLSLNNIDITAQAREQVNLMAAFDLRARRAGEESSLTLNSARLDLRINPARERAQDRNRAEGERGEGQRGEGERGRAGSGD